MSNRPDAVSAFLILLGALGFACAMLASCDRLEEPTFAGSWRWQSTPVSVAAEMDFGYERELELAVATWNKAAGCPIFRLTNAGDIWVQIGEDHPTLRGSTFAQIEGDEITRAVISLHGVAESSQAFRVLMHELGRSVGLQGAIVGEPRMSYMRTDIAENDVLPWFVSDRDADAVAGRYCH